MQLFHNNVNKYLLCDRRILTMNVVHQDGTKQHQQRRHQIHSSTPTTLYTANENSHESIPSMVTSTQTTSGSNTDSIDGVKVIKNKKRTPKYRATKRPQSERRFQCDQCESRFFTQKDVKRHLVVHTGVRNFPCPYCEHRFGRKDHLVRHAKKSHGQDTRSLRRRNKNMATNNGTTTSNNSNNNATTSTDPSRKSKRSAKPRGSTSMTGEADSSRNFLTEPLSVNYATASNTISTSLPPPTTATADPNELFFTRDSSTSNSNYETYHSNNNNNNLNMFSNPTSLISTTTSPKQVPANIVESDNVVEVVAPNTFTSSSTSPYAASGVTCRDHYSNPASFDISYPPSYSNYLYDFPSMNTPDNSNIVANNSYSVASLTGHHQQQQHQNHGFTPPPPAMTTLCCLTATGSNSSRDHHNQHHHHQQQQTQVSSGSNHHHPNHHPQSHNHLHNNVPQFKLPPSTSLYNFGDGTGGENIGIGITGTGIPIEFNNGTSTSTMFQSSTSTGTTSPVNSEVVKIVRHFHDHHSVTATTTTTTTPSSSSLFH